MSLCVIEQFYIRDCRTPYYIVRKSIFVSTPLSISLLIIYACEWRLYLYSYNAWKYTFFHFWKKKPAYYKYCVSRIISFSSSINITFTKSLKVADQTELIMQLWLKSLKHCSHHHHPTSSPSPNHIHAYFYLNV